MWENTAAAFPIQGRRLVPHVELFKSSFSLNSAFKHSMSFCLLMWGQISEGFFYCLLWLLIKSQNCVERKFTSGSNPLPYIPIHRAASSNVLSRNSGVTWNISGRLSNESRGCFFFSLSLYQPEGCTDQHTSTALWLDKTNPQNCTCQLFRWDEKNNTDLFLCLAISQNCVFNLSS